MQSQMLSGCMLTGIGIYYSVFGQNRGNAKLCSSGSRERGPEKIRLRALLGGQQEYCRSQPQTYFLGVSFIHSVLAKTAFLIADCLWF